MKKLLSIFILLSTLANAQILRLTDSTFKFPAFYRPPIMYDFDKETLRPESYIYLDSIVDFLKRNKGVVIEIGVHTDSRSGAQEQKCCRKLYQSRAKCVADYLISKGISSQRVVAKGYGSAKPLIPDAQIAKLKTKEEIEKAHQTNRRKEFRIIRTDYVE